VACSCFVARREALDHASGWYVALVAVRVSCSVLL
jgi:hypothetical protein